MPENINDENTRSYQAHERTGGGDNGKKKKMIIGGVVGAVVLVAVILIIVFATGGKGPHPHPTPPDNPHDPQNHQEFNPMKADTKTVSQSNFEYSIVLDNTKAKPTPTPTLLIQEQQKDAAQDSHDVYTPVNPENIPVGEVNNKWIEKVQVELNLVGENHAHLQLFEQGKTEYKTPSSLFNRPSSDKLANIEQTFNISMDPFSFQIMDRTNEKAFIQTNNRKLVIQDKFKEMGFEVKSKNVYGLGLSNRQFSLETGAYTMYSKTRVGGSVIDTSLGGMQGPAVHPFIMFKTDDDQFAGIYFPNSAPAQFEVIQYDGYDWTIFNYITVSGAIEAYFILPDSAENVLAAYHNMIGMPAFPPIHALGFYQGSDSYNSTEALKAAQKGYDDGHFMLEGFNLDNYNVKNQIFTVDTAADKFDGIKDWVKSLNKDGRSLIIGLIEGVSQESDAYTKLMADNALLLADGTNAITNMLGDVMVAYPDWFSSKTPEYYAEQLASLETMLEAFQGINLADNTSFGKCSGVCMPKTEGATAVLEMVTKLREKRFLFEADAPTDPKNEEDIGNYTSYTIWPDQKTESLEKMPFQMGLKRDSGYQNNTVSIEATHPSVESDNQELYYHNLNAYQSVVELAKQMMTSDKLKSQNKKRPFIMSDSTFPGAGNSTGSWLSNYHRTWEDMRNSIAQVMNLNMFGILLAGNEVCGSLGEFDAELCARWTQNAVLMPAVRNYYNSTYYNTTEKAWKNNPEGEFFQINDDDQFEWRYTVNQAIKQRYSFISYIYTQLYVSHRLGRAYVRPVFFDEPQSAANLADPVEDSYLAGEALHVSTILSPGAKKVNTKFPMGRWVRLSGFMNEVLKVTEGNNEQEVDILSGESIIHMKEGFAIPFQPEIDDVKSTQGLLETHTDILIFRDETGFATGHFMIDDGVSMHDGTNFALFKLRLAANTLQFKLDLGNRAYTQTAPQMSQVIRHVKILDAADLAGTDFACIIDGDFKVTQVLPVFNEGAKTLELRSFGTEYFKPQDVTMIRFGDSTKETNICNVTTSFKYKVQDSFDITKQTGTSMTVPLENLEMSKNTLSAVFTLLDDMGTVKVMFSRDGKTPADQTAGIANEGNFKITNDKLKITDFVSVDMNPFRYTVKATDGTVLYAGANLFFFNPENHLITTFDNFQTNDEVSTPLYGVGGRKGNALVNQNADTMFTTWTSQGSRAYQPFYIYQQKSKEFVGVFDLSTVAMDYQFDTTRDAGEVLLQHISTGAGLQKYVFRGTTPGAVVAKFQQLVGMPMVPPEWAFGWAHYQEGVNKGNDWAEIPQKYIDARMVIDSLWASIDYTDNFEALSVSEDRYGNLTKNIEAVHHKGIKVVPIVESGISMNDANSNTAQTSGAKADAFIKTPDGKIAIGSQHGNKVNYPDVTKAATTAWWKNELAAFNTKYGFDGIWLDKNDLYSDCSGFCSPQNILENDPKADIENQIGYVPGGERLDTHSLDVSAVYSAGTEFELHNKFPLLQAEATKAIYDGAKTRPFLISSTSTAGQSASSVSMSAYNTKTVADMEQSVQDLFMANIYGMPFHGSDVCGFYGEKIDQSLCGRWYLLASMQPFARYANSQQNVMGPWEMTDTLKTDSTKQYTYLIEQAMNLKYMLLRYTISFFHGIAQQGGAYYKPMFFDFPNDLGAYTFTSQNIMLGDSVKMSFNPTSVNYGVDPSHFYFPGGNWCQIYPTKSGNPCKQYKEGGEYMMTDDGKQLTVAEDQIFLHMKEGSIVPFTNVDGKAINVAGVLDLPTSFFLGPPTTAVNKGYLAFDDNGTGDDLLKNVKTFELQSQVREQAGEQVIYLNFTQISGTPVGDKYVKAASKSQNLGLVQVFDVATLYENTKYNVVQCIYNDITGIENVAAAQVTYDSDTESLSFDFTGYKSDRIDGEGINMAYLHYCRVVKTIE